MTPERKKAVWTIGTTFVIGIIIGALGMGMFARQFYHGRGGYRSERREMREGRRGTLTNRIYKIVKADSNQRKLMKPIIDNTMARIDEMEEQSHKEARVELDSLKIKLSSILSTEQIERLEKFLSFKRNPSEGKERHEHNHN